MPSIEARLQRLRDIAAIQELTARYAWHAARAEGAQLAELFVDDGEMDSAGQVMRGAAGLRDYFSRLSPGTTIPHLYNFMIDIKGASAFSRCKMLTPWIGTAEGTCGWYEDHLHGEAGAWRFVRRKWTRHKQPSIEPVKPRERDQ